MKHTRGVLARIALATFTVAVFLAPQVGLAHSAKGGVITDIKISEPPTLDLLATTAGMVVIPSEYSFETPFFTFDPRWSMASASGRNNAYNRR